MPATVDPVRFWYSTSSTPPPRPVVHGQHHVSTRLYTSAHASTPPPCPADATGDGRTRQVYGIYGGRMPGPDGGRAPGDDGGRAPGHRVHSGGHQASICMDMHGGRVPGGAARRGSTPGDDKRRGRTQADTRDVQAVFQKESPNDGRRDTKTRKAPKLALFLSKSADHAWT